MLYILKHRLCCCACQGAAFKNNVQHFRPSTVMVPHGGLAPGKHDVCKAVSVSGEQNLPNLVSSQTFKKIHLLAETKQLQTSQYLIVKAPVSTGDVSAGKLSCEAFGHVYYLHSETLSTALKIYLLMSFM